MDGTWTISELAEHAAAALAADGSAQVSGRVRDLPNERLIRWYTTIGLVDPPLGRRGRTALYGPRHLLQLVAVKRRQAAGRSIAEIQLELAAATDATLRQVAALPLPTPAPAPPPPATARPHTARETARAVGRAPEPTVPARPNGRPVTAATGPAAETAPPDATDVHGTGTHGTSTHGTDADAAESSDAGTGGESGRSAFWSARPDVSYTEAAIADDYGESDASAEARPTVVQGVRLAQGLTLLLDVPALEGDDLAAIETAARPLLDELRRRGLLSPAASPALLPADSSRRSQ